MANGMMMNRTTKQPEESPMGKTTTGSRRKLFSFRNYSNKTKKNQQSGREKADHDAAKTPAAVVGHQNIFVGSSALSLGKGLLMEDGLVQLITTTTTTATTPASSHTSLTTANSWCNNNNNNNNNGSDISFESSITTAVSKTPARTTTSSSSWSHDAIDAACDLWRSDDVERALLRELGRRVEDIEYYKNTPDELVRFLHAKNGDVVAAERMFRSAVTWRLGPARADMALDHPPPPGLIDAIPGAILAGTDRDGDPVFVSRVGTFDAIGAYKKYGREAIVHHCVWIRELAGRGEWRTVREQAMGRPMHQLLIIEDVHGLPLTKLIGHPALLSMYGEMMRIDQENYPDTSKKIIVIRTPALFRMAWNLVKPVFDKYVVEKMIFCGYHDYESVLAQYVDLTVLPPDLLPGIGQGRAEVGMPQRFDGGGLLGDEKGGLLPGDAPVVTPAPHRHEMIAI